MNIPEYALLAAAVILTVVIVALVKRRSSAAKTRDKIRSQWGKKPPANISEEDMQAIAGYYDNLKEADGSRIFLDDITWNDLDMNDIFKRINSTQSTVGEEYLYALLREPITDARLLDKRSRLAELFRNDEHLRTRLQYILARLGKKRLAGASNYFFSKAEYKPFRRIKYIVLLAVFLLSPFVMAVHLSTGLLLLIASFFTNMTTYYKAKNELSAHLDSMSYMVNLIAYSRRIAKCNFPGLEEYTERLEKTASKIKGTSIKSFYQIFYQTQDPLLEYFKIIFLVELISFENINKVIIHHRAELRLLYETVGLLDAMTALASFRESVPFCTSPRLQSSNGMDKPSLLFEEIYHPLIDNPVTNSITMKRSVLITGSNASGKSTFLKTAAINAILAQTIHTCLARRYESGYFRIFTSMALKDSLQNNESYYIAEIKSLKRILDGLNDQIPLFCVIDEVLRGTNTIERIAASSEVLRHLSAHYCICLAATHDLELVSILEGFFDNYHFQESFQDNNIIFDYKILPGKTNTRNAIKLLEIMGYPESTVKAARRNAERFQRDGKWVAARDCG